MPCGQPEGKRCTLPVGVRECAMARLATHQAAHGASDDPTKLIHGSGPFWQEEEWVDVCERILTQAKSIVCVFLGLADTLQQITNKKKEHKEFIVIQKQ